VSLLSWIKGLLKKEKKVTNYITLRQKIKQYNKKEHEEYLELVKKYSSLEKKAWKYFR
tara:strand:+ start:135 stop:308 length:174 start_codon:yes stop_codon:yes gene_type:complete